MAIKKKHMRRSPCLSKRRAAPQLQKRDKRHPPSFTYNSPGPLLAHPASTSTPALSNASAQSKCPLLQAKWRGVDPLVDVQFGSAPCTLVVRAHAEGHRFLQAKQVERVFGRRATIHHMYIYDVICHMTTVLCRCCVGHASLALRKNRKTAIR